MKKILIISSGYPSNGGQASTAYNLNTLLIENNFDVKIIFLKESIDGGNVDPNLVGNSHKINYVKSGNFPSLRKMIKYIISLKIFNVIGITSLFKYAYKILQNFLLKKEIYSHLKKSGFKPDLAITNTPILYESFNKLFKKTIIIIGSSRFFWDFGKKNINYETIKQDQRILKNIKKFKKEILGLNQSHLIYNSQLTHDFFSLHGVTPITKKIQYFNIPPHILHQKKSFNDRKYDIGIIISDFNRKIKGVNKLDILFQSFPEKNKISIGKNSEILNSHLNCLTLDLMSQKELAKYLIEIKLVIIPSLFDPSPSILSEAILNGCNVLCSRNIGWNEYINDNCIVSDYYNNDEWIEKMKYLMDKKLENKRFLQMISNANEKIHKTISNIIEQK